MGPYSCKSNTSRILKGKASTKIEREKDQMVEGGVVAFLARAVPQEIFLWLGGELNSK